MKILHTSDWHLGVSSGRAPRDDEHELFLEWLLETMRERQTQVLIHAGDVYHYTQPSARCQSQFFGFLARCAAETDLQQIVVVGGNHDSPSRLDAPRELLESLDIHVVGGLQADEETWDRCFCPVRNADGEVELVIVGVPYLHEARLGVLTTNREKEEIRALLEERFTHLYQSLQEQAEERWPDVPLVATGHMTCFQHRGLGVDPEYQVPIHFAALIGALPPSIFGLRYNYVALGHIHEINEIPSSNAWYCGSPVPTCAPETRNPRYVLEVRLNPDKPRRPAVVEPLEVPCWRANHEMSGSLEALKEEIAQMQWEEPLPPYLYLEVECEAPLHDGLGALSESLVDFDLDARPRVVRYKEKLLGGEDFQMDPERASWRLDRLSPEEVFTKMYNWHYQQEPGEDELDAFKTLLGESDPVA